MLQILPWLIVMCIISSPVLAAEDQRKWADLRNDGLHDPEGPAIGILQQPGEALGKMPADQPGIGNQIRWVWALEQGFISPRTNLFPDTEIEVLDLPYSLNTED